ncbi:MAG: hypothetical protein B7Y77_02790, partial [Bradyrhizobium sp. 35-63-5]
MTDKRPTPQELAATGGRKRTAPTIDLTATDLTATDVTPVDRSVAEKAAAEGAAVTKPQDDSSPASQNNPQQPADPDSSVIWEPPPESSESADVPRDS